MTRILCYPADASRCGRRIVWPAEYLISQGADIEIVYGAQDAGWDGECDVVVMQRPMLRRYVEGVSPVETMGAIQRLQRDGIKVIIDIDDDFMALNPKNGVWARVHPSYSPDCNWQHLSAACRQADLVTVTTSALARRYGGHGRVAIIPNHVPESYLTIQRPVNDVPVVGWTGAVMTHPDDLQVTRGGVARAVQQTGASFRMVGPVDGVQANLGLSEEPTASGFVDLDDYPFEMAKLDVGIVPLELSAFNAAKSWLKLMEFSALGIPCVGSPTAPNIEFASRYGLPLAVKPKDWERQVRHLILNDDYRLEFGGQLRLAMRAETIEHNAGRWLESWESVVVGGRKVNA